MKPSMCNRYSHCYPAVVLVLWLVFVPLIAAAEQFTGKVVGISDGDTLSVLREGKAVKVRLPKPRQHIRYLSGYFRRLCLG
jgi:endonuclease YncB( thermonuclease family)